MRERFFRYRKAKTAATTAITMNQPRLRTKNEISTTMRVNAGRSAPKPWNRLSNSGITKIIRIAVTTIATPTTAAG